MACLVLLLGALLGSSVGFTPRPTCLVPNAACPRTQGHTILRRRSPLATSVPSTTTSLANNNRPKSSTTVHAAGGDDNPNWQRRSEGDPNELIARRIVVTGDVNGGYYRSCVKNEASRFRKLVGTMTLPEEGATRAEIYVEGKRNMIDGFVRWCQNGGVGLSQVIAVESVAEEAPIGLYDEFYVKTGQ